MLRKGGRADPGTWAEIQHEVENRKGSKYQRVLNGVLPRKMTCEKPVPTRPPSVGKLILVTEGPTNEDLNSDPRAVSLEKKG